MSPLEIIITDPHRLVREGFKCMLAKSGGVEFVGEFDNGNDLLAAAADLSCDVLMLDMSMPGPSGIELIRRLRARHPRLSILVVSIYDDAHTVRCALQAGATGYVDKNCAADMLAIAIRQVARGVRVVDPCLVDILINDQVPPVHENLSRREEEILGLITAGHSGSRIAELLHLSPKTVSTHKKRLMKKLNVGSIIELMQYAIANDLLPR